MDIIEYFASDRKAHWQEKLRACDWSAGQFLCDLLENGIDHAMQEFNKFQPTK